LDRGQNFPPRPALRPLVLGQEVQGPLGRERRLRYGRGNGTHGSTLEGSPLSL
jgi:hypothetical protein